MSQALLLSDPVPSVSLHDGRPATTSLEVAKFFGKTHFHVMRSIKDLIEQLSDNFNQSNFGLASYLDEQAKSRPMYIIKKDGFMLLVMGYTGKKALALKLAYIEAFNRMEAELAKRNRPALPAPTRFDEGTIQELAEEFRQWHQECRVRLRRMYARYDAVATPLLMEAMKRIEGGTFKESVSPLSFDRMLFDQGFGMIAKVSGSYSDTLPDHENPAMYLLDFARAMSAR